VVVRVEVVARVADEPPRVGPAAEDDGRRRGRRGGRLAGATLQRHAAGAAVLEDPLGRHGWLHHTFLALGLSRDR
jgi:hypothetical protein